MVSNYGAYCGETMRAGLSRQNWQNVVPSTCSRAARTAATWRCTWANGKTVVQEQGSVPPRRHLQTLLRKTLHQHVRDDVTRMNLLNAPHQAIVSYLQREMKRWTESKVTQAHTERIFANLPGKKRSTNSLQTAAGAASPEANTSAVQPAHVAPVMETLGMVCAAVSKLNDTRDCD